MSQDLWAAFSDEPATKAPSKTVPVSNNSEILFDQDTALEEGDDFGDFEGGDEDDFGDFEDANDPLASPTVPRTVPKQEQPQATHMIPLPSQDMSSLIDFDDPVFETPEQTYVPTPVQQPMVTSQASLHAKSNSRSFAAVQSQIHPKSPAPSSPVKITPKPVAEPNPASPEPENTFDAFEQQYNTLQKSSFDSLRQIVPSLSNNPSQPETTLPPSNIPPPALILSLFPKIFTQANTALQQILTHPPQILQRFFLDPRVQTFFKAYVALSNVCAFTLAGRKSRWRRDKLLSQSMRIGTADSKIKGMKLMSVDKGEVGREDQEAVEVLRAWRGQLGRLRRCVGEVRKCVGGDGNGVGEVPELSESMLVRVLREGDGGVKSAVCCALCGLNREERVVGVEVEVHDSFGEFWVEQVNMHRWCRNFWDQHKEGLKGR